MMLEDGREKRNRMIGSFCNVRANDAPTAGNHDIQLFFEVRLEINWLPGIFSSHSSCRDSIRRLMQFSRFSSSVASASGCSKAQIVPATLIIYKLTETTSSSLESHGMVVHFRLVSSKFGGGFQPSGVGGVSRIPGFVYFGKLGLSRASLDTVKCLA